MDLFFKKIPDDRDEGLFLFRSFPKSKLNLHVECDMPDLSTGRRLSHLACNLQPLENVIGPGWRNQRMRK